jgi:hypothetical protein
VKECVKLLQAARLADDIYSNRDNYESNLDLNQAAQEIFFARLTLHLTNFGTKIDDQKLLNKLKIISPEIVTKVEDFLVKPKEALYMYEANLLSFFKNISPVPLLLFVQQLNLGNNWQDETAKISYLKEYCVLYPEVVGLIDKFQSKEINTDETRKLIEFLKKNQGRYISKLSEEDIIQYIPGHEKDIEAIHSMIMPQNVMSKIEHAINNYAELQKANDTAIIGDVNSDIL